MRIVSYDDWTELNITCLQQMNSFWIYENKIKQLRKVGRSLR